MSIGVAAHLPGEEHDPQTLIAAADAALYEAKHTGRDQIATMAPWSLDGD